MVGHLGRYDRTRLKYNLKDPGKIDFVFFGTHLLIFPDFGGFNMTLKWRLEVHPSWQIVHKHRGVYIYIYIYTYLYIHIFIYTYTYTH